MSHVQGATVKTLNKPSLKPDPQNQQATVHPIAIQRMKKAMAECEQTYQGMGEMIDQFRTNMKRVREILDKNVTQNLQRTESTFATGKEWADEDLKLQKKFQENAFGPGKSKMSSDEAISDYLNARVQLKLKYAEQFDR